MRHFRLPPAKALMHQGWVYLYSNIFVFATMNTSNPAMHSSQNFLRLRPFASFPVDGVARDVLCSTLFSFRIKVMGVQVNIYNLEKSFGLLSRNTPSETIVYSVGSRY